MNFTNCTPIKLFIFAMAFFLSPLAQAQGSFVFKVLGVSGTVKKHNASGDVAMAPGTKLNGDESIIVENGYCGMLHSSGKAIEVKKPGTYLVSDLVKTIKVTTGKSGKVSERYVNYVMGQLTKAEEEDINANHRKYMQETGSVERTVEPPIKLIALKVNEVLPKAYTLNWNSKLTNVEYLLEVSNLFNETIFTAKTKETSAAVDFAPLFAKHGKNLLVTVKILGRPELKSSDYNFKMAGDISAPGLGLAEEKTPVSCMVNGIICEENNLLLDALAYYKDAYTQENSVTGYKEAYDNLLFRVAGTK